MDRNIMANSLIPFIWIDLIYWFNFFVFVSMTFSYFNVDFQFLRFIFRFCVYFVGSELFDSRLNKKSVRFKRFLNESVEIWFWNESWDFLMITKTKKLNIVMSNCMIIDAVLLSLPHGQRRTVAIEIVKRNFIQF